MEYIIDELDSDALRGCVTEAGIFGTSVCLVMAHCILPEIGPCFYMPQSKGHHNPYVSAPKAIYFKSAGQRHGCRIKTPDSRSGMKGTRRLRREGGC